MREMALTLSARALIQVLSHLSPFLIKIKSIKNNEGNQHNNITYRNGRSTIDLE